MITRKEAKEQELKRYFTGKPCKHGHISERYVATKGCIDCNTLRFKSNNMKKKAKIRYLKNKEHIQARSTKYWHDNKVELLEYHKNYRNLNRERIRERNMLYYYDHIDEISAHRKANKDVDCARSIKRYAAKLQRTVAWSDKDEIQHFYSESNRLTFETGIQHNVDHIFPLQGDWVSGLHVEDNLQVMPGVENRKKMISTRGVPQQLRYLLW